jgi:AraC-like DNA-binding protein
MKAAFEDIGIKQGNQAYLAYALEVPAFPFKWHYHPEYELTLITKGKGKRLVGDHYDHYEEGDLVLLGPNLPHTWVSHTAGRRKKVSAIVIQFPEKVINGFIQLDECKKIAGLLSASAHGLYFKNHTLTEEILALPQKTGTAKITGLLHILDQLTKQKAIVLASDYYKAARSTANEKRVNTVCRFLQKNATENISIQTLADLVNLSVTAFCKFFKRATGLTVTDYLNDIRIGNACELLVESDLQIKEIAYQVGFQSLTYFNRVFLKKKNMTPRAFRESISHS